LLLGGDRDLPSSEWLREAYARDATVQRACADFRSEEELLDRLRGTFGVQQIKDTDTKPLAIGKLSDFFVDSGLNLKLIEDTLGGAGGGAGAQGGDIDEDFGIPGSDPNAVSTHRVLQGYWSTFNRAADRIGDQLHPVVAELCDFFYVPPRRPKADVFGHRGYAFVNLRHAEHARLFLKILSSGVRLSDDSTKEFRLCPAHIQGIEQLKDHFAGKCEMETLYPPLFLTPAGVFSAIPARNPEPPREYRHGQGDRRGGKGM
jgi:hypothetical protein